MNKGKFDGDNKYKFKRGKTNKEPQLFWDKAWLEKEFSIKSVETIAKEFGIGKGAIYFWLDKHGIQKKKPTGLILKYWWDGKHITTTLEMDGKSVKSGVFSK